MSETAPNRRTFAIDYDHTYTADPEGFDLIIALLRQRGHRVFVITSRTNLPGDSVSKENRQEVQVPGCAVIFTNGEPKAWHMARRVGIKIDIWIDDDPASIVAPKTWR